jgi:DNA-binding NarL/FixJ family response regulator
LGRVVLTVLELKQVDRAIRRAHICVLEKRSRILLADDHPLVAAALAKLLEADFDVVGIVGDGVEAVAEIKRDPPDVVLLDISIPNPNGFETARQIRCIAPNCKIIFVAVRNEMEYVVEAFRVGASGYLLKASAASELLMAVHDVLKGKMYLTPLIARAVVYLDLIHDTQRQPLSLSPRQREVLYLVAAGCTAKEIAVKLDLSPKTVDFHKIEIKKKLGLHTTAALTRYAVENGISGK